jgi:hypothetical protein
LKELRRQGHSMRGLLLFILMVFRFILPAQAAPIDLRRVSANLTNPVLVTHAGDARLFIVQQPGIITVFRPGTIAPTTFLDIRSRISAGGERGLLGLAFHPEYRANGRFFVFYTRSGDGALAIAEYRVSSDPNIAETIERMILTIPHPTFANHNGGMIAFGPDGYLYIGTGDGGSGNDPSNNAQNLESLLGKILRINVNTALTVPYVSPSTNPFVGRPGRDEIWIYGLRNPWRFSFDRLSGNLVIGDVGQNAWEEIDVVTAAEIGGNLGWRVYEGSHCTSIDPQRCTGGGYVFPIMEYDHSGGRCSVTGGYHYRGLRRATSAGEFLFADYCSGTIYRSAASMTGNFVAGLDTALVISSFGEDAAGELHVCDHGGSVYRIVNGARGDFGGDAGPLSSRSDLVWRHSRSGRNAIWQVGENLQRMATIDVEAVPDPDWEIRGSADFDGDGHVDLLWRNRRTGNNAVWFMDGPRLRASQTIQGVVDADWQLVGANDFNGDGWPDLVWRNLGNGHNAIWLMYGTSFVDSRPLPDSPDLGWQIGGLDDMNDDGWNDIVWTHGTGGNAVWLMNGTTFSSSVRLPAAAGPWDLSAVADMSGDNKPDLIWRNRVSGENAVWLMNDLAFGGVAYLQPERDPDFRIVAPR